MDRAAVLFAASHLNNLLCAKLPCVKWTNMFISLWHAEMPPNPFKPSCELLSLGIIARAGCVPCVKIVSEGSAHHAEVCKMALFY